MRAGRSILKRNFYGLFSIHFLNMYLHSVSFEFFDPKLLFSVIKNLKPLLKDGFYI